MGFHQTDNHPAHELRPVTETPEVRAAREEHERLWKEAAKLNGVDPDANFMSNADRFESEDDDGNDEDEDDDDELEGQVSNQHQSLSRYPALPYSGHIVPENAKSFGRVVGDAVVVDSIQPVSRFARQRRQQQNEVDEDDNEIPSEPRGFFYSFDYPVPFLKRAASAEASERRETRVHFDAPARRVAIVASESKVQPRRVLASKIDDESKSDSNVKLVKSTEQREPTTTEEVSVVTQSAKKNNVKKATSSRGSIKFKSNSNL